MRGSASQVAEVVIVTGVTLVVLERTKAMPTGFGSLGLHVGVTESGTVAANPAGAATSRSTTKPKRRSSAGWRCSNEYASWKSNCGTGGGTNPAAVGYGGGSVRGWRKR